MSEETKNTNTGEQSTNSTPEANGGHGGEKMFTQEDVNRIIAERLAKERAKGQPPAADQRERELPVREQALECRDFLESENQKRGTNYPAAELVHLLGARPLAEFKDALHEFEKIYDKMVSTAPHREPPEPNPTADSRLRSAFGLK